MHRHSIRSIGSPKLVVGCLSALLIATSLGTVAFLGATHGSPTSKYQRTAAEITSSQIANAEASAKAAQQASLPTPLLPADQRQPWISAWDSMAKCMVSQGIKSFPQAPVTFGDGRTTPPSIGASADIDPASASFQAAEAACPFNTSGLNATAFSQADSAWEQQHSAVSPNSTASASDSAGQSTALANQKKAAQQAATTGQ
jgi:hypothetical protein